MIFKRKIYDELLKWKNNSNGQSALLIEGSRCVGKSTIVEEFAKNEYESYLLIDFAVASSEVKECFNKYMDDLDTFFMYLQSKYNVNFIKRKTLIIFDEIQLFPLVRQAIKFLIQDGRYDYIETGSLISIHENFKNFPISKEEVSLKMYPLDFEEFLWANNETQLGKMIKHSFDNLIAMPEDLHELALDLFKQYILIGGMPKSVKEFLENERSFAKSDERKRMIVDLYRDSIYKIKYSYKIKTLILFDLIPSFLFKKERRVVFKKMEEGTRFDTYESAFTWLKDSQITNLCFLCDDSNDLLSLSENRKYVKCYMCDTGLLVTQSIDSNSKVSDANKVYEDLLNAPLSLYNGMFYENAIAQELVSKGHKLYFYNHYSEEKHRNDIEVQFIVTNSSNSKIIPIEIKFENKYQIKSLTRFIEKFSDKIDKAYIIHPKNLIIKENGIICIPPYMTFCL